MSLKLEADAIQATEQTTPSNPATGDWKLYFKADGLYFLDDAGNETSAGGGSGTIGGSTGATDNAIIRADGTGGSTVQSSGVLISDEDDITIPAGGQLIVADSASVPPLNITERSTAPSTPATGDIYLDDGTNTASTNPGWRRYNGSTWEDVSAAGGASTTVAEYNAIDIGSAFNTTSTSYVNVTGSDQSHTFTQSTALVITSVQLNSSGSGVQAQCVIQVDGTDGNNYSAVIATTPRATIVANYFTGISTSGAVTIRLRLKSSDGNTVTLQRNALAKYTIIEGI